MIVYLLLAGTGLVAGLSRCPETYPYVYRPLDNYDYCCKTDGDSSGNRWVDGGYVDNCKDNNYIQCPDGSNCYTHKTKTSSNICPNGYQIETHWGVPTHGDICRRIEGHNAAGTMDYMCPHGCVVAQGRQAPYCVNALTGSNQDICRIESSEWSMKHTSPQEERVAFIYNSKYTHTKFKTGGHDGTIQYTPDYNVDASMLWKFTKGEIAGTWIIKGLFNDDSGKEERLRCSNNGLLSTVYNGELSPRDQWYVRPVKTPGMAGYYTIENAGMPGYYASVYSSTGGGCQPPRKNCVQYADSSHNTKCDKKYPDNGFGEWSGDCDSTKDCWGPMVCKGECKDMYPWWSWNAECCIYKNGDAKVDFDHKFRLEDLFATDAAWTTVSILQNDTPDNVHHEYTLQYGVTNSYTKSMSFTLSLERSMSAGVSAEADGIGASAEQSTTIGMEWTMAAEQTTETSQMQKWVDSFDLQGGQCKKIQTITMAAADACTSVSFSFYTKIARVVMCGEGDIPDCTISSSNSCDDAAAHYPDASRSENRLPAKPARWEVPLLRQGEGVCYEVSDCEAGLLCSTEYCGEAYGAYDKCCGKMGTVGASTYSASSSGTPKLHSIDQEYHLKESNTESVMDKEESWLKNERIEKNAQAQAMTITNAEGPGILIEGLAALGLCATLYGAYRHYSQK